MNALTTQTESEFNEIEKTLTGSLVTHATLLSTMKVKQNKTEGADDGIKVIIQKYICDTRRHFFKLSCTRVKAELRLNEWCPIRCRALKEGMLTSVFTAGDPSKQDRRT
jgi:hypothetical protein